MTIRATVVRDPALARIRRHAMNAWIAGESHVRDGDRKRFGPEDQLIGQLGEFALARYLGDVAGYFDRREMIDHTPYKGDGGSDVLGRNVDVKTSLMRGPSNPMRYNLLVRPAERHAANLYILALVRKEGEGFWVGLVGGAYDYELPKEKESSGPFEGAYRIRAIDLREVGALL